MQTISRRQYYGQFGCRTATHDQRAIGCNEPAPVLHITREVVKGIVSKGMPCCSFRPTSQVYPPARQQSPYCLAGHTQSSTNTEARFARKISSNHAGSILNG